jgi:quinolinate synthase
VVFCGVHFMAESADILVAPHQQVILPDLAAGCSMADMAATRSARSLLGRDADDGRFERRAGDLHQLDRGN